MHTIAQLSKSLREKKISALELTRDYIARAKAGNEALNAYVTIAQEDALLEAKRADEVLRKGAGGVLTGIPFGVKDAICTVGLRSTAGAKLLDNYLPPYAGTVLGRITAQAGVLMGKHNCDAFGHGASNENSMYGTVRNPYDRERVPGGSSGGSAAAVAADLCVYAIAEDTGGSIRQPASFCNAVGLRPSYGRNSRYGIMPMASSLDTVGPLTKTVEDCALVLDVMAGPDHYDATTVPERGGNYAAGLRKDINGLRVGVPREYTADLNPKMRERVEAASGVLRKLGAEVREVSLPHTKYAIPVYYVVVPCEDSSNLARIDGIRFGVRAEGETLEEVYRNGRAAGFPAEVKRRIMIGTFALSHGYYDAYYKKAQKVRTRIMYDFDAVFGDVDVLLTPTTPTPAFKLGEKTDDPLAMYLADVFVCPAAVAGVPAISVPGGFVDGLPVGVQFIGPRLSEALLLRTAWRFEQETNYGAQAPEMVY